MTEKDIIAEIKLAPGEIGYYDDYSRIYLTQQSPKAYIYAGTNTTQIIRSVASGRLLLIRGTFDVKKAQENREAELIKQRAEQERKAQALKMAEIADIQAKEEKERLEKEAKEEAKKAAPVEPEEKKEVPVEKVEEVEPEKPVKRTSRRNKKSETVVKEEAEEASK